MSTEDQNMGIPEAGAAPGDEAIVKAGGLNDPTTPPEYPMSTAAIGQETEALINALRTRAMAEANAAGTFAYETYMNAVRKARQSIEEEKLVKPNELED
ncbi:MAG: hypothetical protein AAF289_02985, partial [Cyanobacteria bacterium P01_A01_bin.135]